MDILSPTIAKTFWILHRETNVARTMIATGQPCYQVDELLSQLWRLQGRLENRAASAPDASRDLLTEICSFTRSRLEATEQSLSLVSTLH